MDPLSISASIITLLELTSKVITYLSDVKGGPEELRTIRREVSSVSSILIMLQDQADQTKQDRSFSLTLRSLNVPNGPFVQLHTALEHLALLLAPTKGWRRIGKAFKWPIEKEETLRILNTIERQKSLFTLARQNDHIALSTAIGVDIKSVSKRVDEIALGITTLQTSERYNIRQWLSAPDPSSNYNKALKSRLADTGIWILRNNTYIDWLSKPGSHLWLYGIPGCGKTILSSAVIQSVVEDCQSRTNSVVLYFYFDFNDIEKQQYEKMIRSLVVQLSSKSARTLQLLESLYSSCMNGDRQPTYELLLTTLHHMIGGFEDTYLIIDALDECLERQELLAGIKEFPNWEDTNLHILTTSRNERNIEDCMDYFVGVQESIRIQSVSVEHDIRAYIHHRLQTDQTLRRWQKQHKVQQKIENSLMDKAGGMYVSYHVAAICTY